MTPERWNQIEVVFSAAADKDLDDRQAYLDEACAHDAGLRADVENLLSEDENGAKENFLEETVLGPPDQPTLPPGTMIGDFKVLEEIGRGGMGVVYKAQQVSLDRIVALKMILRGNSPSEDDVKRFRTEAQATANLCHANIVAVYEVSEHEGQHYFSMEYVDGQTLAKLTRDRENPLPVTKAAAYVKIIAEAIHAVHEHGILHRDLKPSNVLIDRSDRVRITDFGLAKRLKGDSTLTSPEQIMGTLAILFGTRFAQRG